MGQCGGPGPTPRRGLHTPSPAAAPAPCLNKSPPSPSPWSVTRPPSPVPLMQTPLLTGQSPACTLPSPSHSGPTGHGTIFAGAGGPHHCSAPDSSMASRGSWQDCVCSQSWLRAQGSLPPSDAHSSLAWPHPHAPHAPAIPGLSLGPSVNPGSSQADPSAKDSPLTPASSHAPSGPPRQEGTPAPTNRPGQEPGSPHEVGPRAVPAHCHLPQWTRRPGKAGRPPPLPPATQLRDVTMHHQERALPLQDGRQSS